MTENETLPNPSQFTRFKEHLSISDNSRVIFSGKFGIGKTTFLQEFFKKEQPNNYVIYLSPVHYSISSNEDIIDLLKYDIIYHILSDIKVNTEENEFTDKEIRRGFWDYKAPELILSLLESSKKIGEPISKIAKALGKFDSDYRKFKSKIQEGENAMLKSLEVEMSNRKSTLNYEDFFTEFIKNNLAEIKSIKEGSETILIIDDLDRVDPEHIFRLFNVFAAHLHAPNNEDNKFGFDKVIFSCDIDNIQSIYHHKYGAMADFSGYIDKFYNRELFRLDNREVIKSWIERYSLINHENFSSGDVSFLSDVFNCMVSSRVLNFRSITSVTSYENIKPRLKKVIEMDQKEEMFRDTSFPHIAPVLSSIVGDTDLLLQKLEECKRIMQVKTDKNFTQGIGKAERYFQAYLCPVVEIGSSGRFLDRKMRLDLKKYNLDANNLYLEYKLSYMGSKVVATFDNENPSQFKAVFQEGLVNDIFWDALIKAIKLLREKGYLD